MGLCRAVTPREKGGLMDDFEWREFLEARGLPPLRVPGRGMAEEVLLFAFFAARPVAGEGAGEVYERQIEGRSILLDRKTAVGIGRELMAAGAPYDNGDPAEGERL